MTIIESHIHSVSLANRPGYHTILENTASIREIQEALAARRKEVPEGQWITSMGGWHPNQWAEHRHPTRKELDDAVPDRPVLLYERFTGPCATNSLGKAFFDAADAGPLVHPNIVKVNVSDTGVIAPTSQAYGPAQELAAGIHRIESVKRIGDVHGFANFGSEETGRRHADDGERCLVDANGPAQDSRTTGEAALPVGIADHGCARSAGAIVFRSDEPAERGIDAE